MADIRIGPITVYVERDKEGYVSLSTDGYPDIEQLKPIIAAPPELLMVNRKGLHPYYALNRVFVVAFSNERVAISLPSDDRRWFVAWAEAGRLPEAEAVGLWNWYHHRGGFAGVAA